MTDPSQSILYAIQNNIQCDEIISRLEQVNIFVDQRICDEIFYLRRLYRGVMRGDEIAKDEFYPTFNQLVEDLISIPQRRINTIIRTVNLGVNLGLLVSKYDFYLQGIKYDYKAHDIRDVIVTDDGRLLLKMTNDLLVFDPKKKEVKKQIDVGATDFPILTTGNKLIIRYRTNLIVWNIDTGFPEGSLDITSPIVLLPAYNLIITGTDDLATLIIWNFETNEIESKLLGHTSPINKLELLDHLLASGSNNGELKVWDLSQSDKEKCIASFIHDFVPPPIGGFLIPPGLAPNTNMIDFIGILPDNRIVSASYKVFRIWSLDTGLLIHEIATPSIVKFHIVNTKQGKMIVGLSIADHFLTWNTITGQVEQEIDNMRQIIIFPSQKEDKIIAIFRDRNLSPEFIAQYEKNKSKIFIISPTEGITYSFDGHRDEVTAMILLSSVWDNSIVSISRYGMILIWNYETGQVIRQLQGNYHFMSQIFNLPKGNFVIKTDNYTEEITLQFWE